MKSWVGPGAAVVLCLWASAAPAQTVKPFVATPPSPSYGAQPYHTGGGFYHPNNMGHGGYHNATKLTGRRSGSLNGRRFKGY